MATKTTPRWLIKDSGVKGAEHNMEIDREALDRLDLERHGIAILRFFQWLKPVVTYGRLLDPVRVQSWAIERGVREIVERPTGGGAVLHRTDELALSILWPRGTGSLSDHPREAYAHIHETLLQGLIPCLPEKQLVLREASDRLCAAPEETRADRRFSACFQEPVCNDVMLEGRKIIGGAMRLTKSAVLYQGSIQLDPMPPLERLKNYLLAALANRLNFSVKGLLSSSPSLSL